MNKLRSTMGFLLCAVGLASVSMARDLGVDVSHYQGAGGNTPVTATTWQTVKNAGKTFAYIKATEGLTNADDATMSGNLTNAAAANLITGVYHYAHPANRPTVGGAIQEADHFFSYSGSAISAGHLRPLLDIEGTADTLTPVNLTAWVIAFCNEIVADAGGNTSYTPIIYCGQFDANYAFTSDLANYDCCIADYSYNNPQTDALTNPGRYASATGVFNNWAMWQYSSSGTSGSLTSDVDVVHSEYKPLSSLLITVPEPAVATILALIGMTATRLRSLRCSG